MNAKIVTIDVDYMGDKEDAKYEYGITLIEQPKKGHYDAIVLAVAHNEFIDLGVDAIRGFGHEAYSHSYQKRMVNAERTGLQAL